MSFRSIGLLAGSLYFAALAPTCNQARGEHLPTLAEPVFEALPLAPIDWDAPEANGYQAPPRARGSSVLANPVGEVEVITERYENRAVKIRREVRQDAQRNYVNHGRWTLFDPQGRVLADGQYRDGKRHGAWMRVVSTEAALAPSFQGPLVSRAQLRDDQLDGTWTISDANNRSVSSWDFHAGTLHGKVIAWYASGQQQSEMQFVNGQPHGDATFWRPDGTVAARHYYRDGKQLVPVVERYDPQQKQSEGWLLRGNVTYQVTADWWHDVMHIARIPTDGEEVRTGRWRHWYPNGNLSFDGQFKDGVPVGLHTWWHDNGQKSQAGQYQDGQQELVWTQWHPTGHKLEEGSYVAGLKQGPWTTWDEQGQVVSTVDMSLDGGGDSLVEQSPAEESGLSLQPALSLTQ